MSFSTRPALARRFQLVLTSFQQHPGLPFADVLSEAQIEAAFAEQGALFAQAAEDIYTPAVTLWAFLSQALFKQEQRSCLAAVCRVVVLLVALERPRPSGDTGDYCRARAKLSEAAIQRLVMDTAARLEGQAPAHWLWHGRHVKLVDGTTVTAADTAANQQAWPQQPQQAPGLGFPILRIVVLLSLATAMVCGMGLGPYAGKQTSEIALFRGLLGQLAQGDIVLADRYYCSYFQIALLHELGVDFVARLHQLRTADFRRGLSLGKHDHVVTWFRPARPSWMDQQTYERMPKSLTLREVRVQVREPGFRVESLVVVTTLTDAKQFRREEIAQLYHRRWLVELDIRAIKESLGLDVLRGKSPEMVRKELWAGLLAYNLIRQTMAQSAAEQGIAPRGLSFTAALQQLAAAWCVLPLMEDPAARRMVKALRKQLTLYAIGDRPNRVEPRAVKRRPKPHDLLRVPRAVARALLLAGRG
jgi:hypothetical protein